MCVSRMTVRHNHRDSGVEAVESLLDLSYQKGEGVRSQYPVQVGVTALHIKRIGIYHRKIPSLPTSKLLQHTRFSECRQFYIWSV